MLPLNPVSELGLDTHPPSGPSPGRTAGWPSRQGTRLLTESHPMGAEVRFLLPPLGGLAER